MTTRVLNPEQMRLFMRPDEIKEAVTGSFDASWYDDMRDLWRDKEQESRKPAGRGHGAGLYDALKEQNVAFPVELTVRPGATLKQHLYMSEGHHRVAAAAAVERATRGTPEERTHWIPVRYEYD